MGSKRNTDTDVQPTGSQVTHSRARSRSGLLAFLRPRQTVSPGAQNASPDQATASRINTLSPSSVQPDTNCTPVFDSDWSNLPDHLIESVLHVLQSSESDPLHPSNKPARLVRAPLPSARTACQHPSQHNSPSFCCSLSSQPPQCPESGATLANAPSFRTSGMNRDASDILCSFWDWCASTVVIIVTVP